MSADAAYAEAYERAYRDAYSMVNEEMHALTTRCAQYRMQCVDLKAQLAERDQDASAATKRHASRMDKTHHKHAAELAKVRATHEERVALLEAQLKTAHEAGEVLRKAYADQEALMERVKRASSENAKDVVSLRTLNKHVAQEMVRLRTQNESLHTALIMMEHKVRMTDAENEKLNDTLGVMATQMDAMK